MPPRVSYPRWQIILYASGSLSVALSYQAFATYIQFVYIDVFGLTAVWVGLVWSLYGLWNAVNDPLTGYLSDRTRTRWGRRIPWIAGAFVPLAVTFYLLWTPPAVILADKRRLLLYFLTFVMVFDLLWTVVVMNWTALFPEMIPDEKQRATVSGWRQVFSLIGLLIGVALPPILAGADWSGRGSMALLLAGITALFIALSLIGSRERQSSTVETQLPLRATIQTTLRNRDFRYFLGTNLAIQFILMMLAATVPFYTKYVLRLQEPLTLPFLGVTLDVATQTSLFLAVTFLVALPAMPVWTWLAQRWGAWRTLRAACLAGAFALCLFFIPDNFYEGLAATLIFGCMLAGLLMLPDLLIADLVDADRLQTGSRREGMYFGINGLVIRLAFTIQGVITATMFTVTGYISPSAATLYPEQPLATLWGIRLMLGGIPALAALLAFFLLHNYALRGERLARVQQALAALQGGIERS